MKRFDTSLYFITDSTAYEEDEFLRRVDAALQGGVTILQIREKNKSTRAYIDLAEKVHTLTRRYGVPLIIDDRVDVALAVDADGVHIGQSDIPYEIARRLLGPDKIIGLSVETMDEVIVANALDVDYVAVSPVFSTSTKTDTLAPFGYDGLEQACRLTRHPICGIGGMNASTVGEAIARGADGVAVVSAIVSAPDPELASKNLKSIINNELDKRRLG